MFVNNVGYVFECRKDCLGNVGVLGSYRILYRENLMNLTITCALDSTGQIIIPAINDLSSGFRPLTTKCTNREELDRFCKSNKPIFGKLGEFVLLASGTISFDVNTGNIVSTKDLKFYVPKAVNKDTDGNPCLICDVVSNTVGLNTFQVDNSIYQAYLKNFLGCLHPSVIPERSDFLYALIQQRGA